MRRCSASRMGRGKSPADDLDQHLERWCQRRWKGEIWGEDEAGWIAGMAGNSTPAHEGVQRDAASGDVAAAGSAAVNAPNLAATRPRLTAGCQIALPAPALAPTAAAVDAPPAALRAQHWLECSRGRSPRSHVWLSKALQSLDAHASFAQTHTPAAVGGAAATRQRRRRTGRAPAPPCHHSWTAPAAAAAGVAAPRVRAARGAENAKGRLWVEAEGGPGRGRGWPATDRRAWPLATKPSKKQAQNARYDCRGRAAAPAPPPYLPPADTRDDADDAHRPLGRPAGPALRAARSSVRIFVGGKGGGTGVSGEHALRCRAGSAGRLQSVAPPPRGRGGRR